MRGDGGIDVAKLRTSVVRISFLKHTDHDGIEYMVFWSKNTWVPNLSDSRCYLYPKV